MNPFAKSKQSKPTSSASSRVTSAMRSSPYRELTEVHAAPAVLVEGVEHSLELSLVGLKAKR